MNAWDVPLEKLVYKKRGVKFIFDNNVDNDVKKSFKRFLKWAKTHYYFPTKLYVFIRGTDFIKASDGDLVHGRSFMPDDHIAPFIEVAVGDFSTLKSEDGRDNAIATLLHCLIHEMTHYFQLLSDPAASDDILEEQAEICAEEIMERYQQTRMHP